jgi:hypothetical protein
VMLCTGIDLQRQTKPSWGRSHGNTISAKWKYVVSETDLTTVVS